MFVYVCVYVYFCVHVCVCIYISYELYSIDYNLQQKSTNFFITIIIFIKIESDPESSTWHYVNEFSPFISEESESLRSFDLQQNILAKPLGLEHTGPQGNVLQANFHHPLDWLPVSPS